MSTDPRPLRAPLGAAAAVLAATVVLVAAAPAGAILPREPSAPNVSLAYADPDLGIPNYVQPIDRLPPALATSLRPVIATLGAEAGAFYDVRAGRWGTLLLSVPLIPGKGAGNLLQWSQFGIAGAPTTAQIQSAAWNGVEQYLAHFAPLLGVSLAELPLSPRITVHEDGRLVQIYAQRTVDGVPVRDSFLLATLNAGNLVVLGTRNWGAIDVPTTATISAEQAKAVVAAHVAPATIASWVGKATLTLVPTSAGPLASVVPGHGLAYRLAWDLGARIAGDRGGWEALVDARSGELLMFGDRNQYATRSVSGGIYPVSNDGIAPDGVEQQGYPMPFADLHGSGDDTFFTNAQGLHTVDGTLTTSLSGKFVKIADNCGPITETLACGDFDLGDGPGTDCAVPAGHSAGDTHSARTGFFELNRLIGMAKAYLPENAWLGEQLTANMNIDDVCNAFWDGLIPTQPGTVNFFKSGTYGSHVCGNTGEIAAVFDHEWGHGLDNNDNIPNVTLPGEGYADVTALYRLNASCVGRGFFQNHDCGGEGDACTSCNGVREDDWAKHASGRPHDIDWVMSVNPDVPGGCAGSVYVPPPIPGLQTGPCLQETHCEGQLVGETFWDLSTRDLQGFEGSPAQLDPNSALEVATHLFFLGAGNVNSWYQCIGQDSGLGGCNADSGYLQMLSADDDNGNLVDGTPHMEAIFRAFDRHQMACAAPLPVTSGCAAAPKTATTVTATASPNGARLSWTPVAGASEYWVYRNEGVHGFAFGKERIARTADTFAADAGLDAGRAYNYGVLAVSNGGACLGPMSAPATVTPTADAPPAVARFALSATATPVGGDGDEFLDNCETARLTVKALNTGTVPLSNVRVVAVRSTSNPASETTTALPKSIGSLSAACGSPSAEGTTTVDVAPHDLASDGAITFEVEATADEIAPATVTTTLTVGENESDWIAQASRTWSFENDLEGWQVAQGTFATQAAGPAGDGTQYVASSAATDLECDEIRSPEFRLTPATTVSLFTQYSTEPYNPADAAWYDRANLALVDASGKRHTVSPDGGRLYAASGANGACVTSGQPGWSTDATGDTGLGWQSSSFSADAVSAAGLAGERARIDLAYGTDDNLSGTGFWFDGVTLANFEERGADAQGDVCRTCAGLDDNDASVEYAGGWLYIRNAQASSGGYHRRKGTNSTGGDAPAARLVFSGTEVTLLYATSKYGGQADVFIDGAKAGDTLGMWGDTNQPSFGKRKTYSGLPNGRHEIKVVWRAGQVIVDGFEFCSQYGGTDASAVRFRSETTTSTATAADGPVILRTVKADSATRLLTVEVEGAPLALGVKLLNSLGQVVASASNPLLPGFTDTGLDFEVPAAGTYTVQVLNALPLGASAKIHVARTQAVP